MLPSSAELGEQQQQRFQDGILKNTTMKMKKGICPFGSISHLPLPERKAVPEKN